MRCPLPHTARRVIVKSLGTGYRKWDGVRSVQEATLGVAMPVALFREFLRFEAAGGIVLIIAAALALILANSALGGLYVKFLDIPLAIQVGALIIAKPLLLWINDGLMAVFFFLVGLEIKREFLEGGLSSASQFSLPAVAAVGGMVVPAAVYVLVNIEHPENLDGWAIPAATDIAFALGILALVGSRAPLAIKVLLTAVAIIDDLGAIIIIALFYTDDLLITSLYLAAGATAVLIALNLFGVRRAAPYILVGIVLWVCVLKSGVHATLAGVVTALAIPLRPRQPGDPSLLRKLEHELHPWVAFMVLPIFAFANAGVSFEGLGLDSFVEPIKLGISLGLFVGKQIGIFGAMWLAIRFGLAPMPPGTNWRQLYAVAVLCGVGFTMSLFIGSLAFAGPEFEAPIRLGVLTGSILSAILGYLLFYIGPGARDTVAVPAEPEAAAPDAAVTQEQPGPSGEADSPTPDSPEKTQPQPS